MIRRHGNALRTLLMLADGVVAAVIALILYQSVAHPDAPVRDFFDVFWVRSALCGVLWVVILYLTGAYRLRAHWTVAGEIRTVGRATFWMSLAGVVTLFIAGETITDRAFVLLLFPLSGLAAIVVRSALRVTFMYFRGVGHNARNLLILGTGPAAVTFAQTVREHSLLGVDVVGYLGSQPPSGQPAHLYWGHVSELPTILRTEVIDEVAVCVESGEWPQVEEFVELAHEEGKMIRVPLLVPHLNASQRFLEDLDGLPVMSYGSGPDELAAHALKRTFDIGLGAITLVLMAPVLIAIAIILRWKQGPGVIFAQTRVGVHGRPFTIFKFRTMRPDAEHEHASLATQSTTRGAAFKMVDDPRVTPSGRVLRRWSLDELPQLFNVLRGEMSMIGPRPAPPREVEDYDLWHRRRLSMKPGITGLWQVTSRMDQEFDDRAELDLAYIDRWSIWLDLAILVRTIPAIIRRPGH